ENQRGLTFAYMLTQHVGVELLGAKRRLRGEIGKPK
ncbi:hypothetical protein PSYJA_46121, partial [Pseudomonas syringae pv. japonica str. M301072]